MHLGIDIQQVCPSVISWSRYAPEVKAELFSTGLLSAGGVYLVDPISVDLQQLRLALAPANVAAVIVTNENHARAAADMATAFGVDLCAHRETWSALALPPGAQIEDGGTIAPGVTAIALEGAPAGEVAIHATADGGSLIVGDALINMGSYGFTFLPPKYCRNQKQMRRSLRKLLDFDFARICFAHGLPIVTDAKRRLIDLLESGA